MRPKFKLTWQTGTNGRNGRWKKKYKGKSYYFDGGCGKSDQSAYKAALAAWERLKHRLDGEAPKPHQADYEREIVTWEDVLAWSQKHHDDKMAEEAVAKLKALKSGLAPSRPKPLPRELSFEGWFDPTVRNPAFHAFLSELGKDLTGSTDDTSVQSLPGHDEYTAATQKFVEGVTDSGHGNRQVILVPSKTGFDLTDPLTGQRDLWRDRLDVMKLASPLPEETVKHFLEKFLVHKKGAVTAKLLSAGRYAKLKSHLGHFQQWVGQGTAVSDFASHTLTDYRTVLLKAIEEGKWNNTTASDRMESVKSFVRWLYQVEAITSLPRVLGTKSNALEIGKSTPDVVIFKKEEIILLLEKASARTTLYLLLMLNCGMTQKDISDLDFTEVDWEAGRIIRKRSKTRKFDSVPVVRYLLWPETLQLLRQERCEQESGCVLLNARGGPLLYEGLGAEDKCKKNDNIRNAYERLRRKVGIKKPLKSLKKTSVSFIYRNDSYRGLEVLFLGH
jgi:integrase